LQRVVNGASQGARERGHLTLRNRVSNGYWLSNQEPYRCTSQRNGDDSDHSDETQAEPGEGHGRGCGTPDGRASSPGPEVPRLEKCTTRVKVCQLDGKPSKPVPGPFVTDR
jgi:hypothetical protein